VRIRLEWAHGPLPAAEPPAPSLPARPSFPGQAGAGAGIQARALCSPVTRPG